MKHAGIFLRMGAATWLAASVSGCAPVNRGSPAPSPASRIQGQKSGQLLVDPVRADSQRSAALLPTRAEEMVIQKSYEQLRERQIRLLDCTYRGDSGGSHYLFWTGALEYSRNDFLKISPAHPLALLPEQPLGACPGNQAVALRLHDEALATYQAAAQERLRQLAVRPAGMEATTNDNRCIRATRNEYSGLGIVNDCDFAVSVVFDEQPVGVNVGVRRALAQEAYLKPHGGQVVDYANGRGRNGVSWFACHYTMVPVSRTSAAIALPGEAPRDNWRCERRALP